MSRPPRALAWLVTLLLLAGCAQEPDPAAVLDAAVAATVDGPVALALRAELPDEVLGDLAGAGDAGSLLPLLLSDATLGVVFDRERTGLALQVRGAVVAEARDLGDGELLLRLDAAALAGLTGAGLPDGDDLPAALDGAGLSAEAVAAVRAATTGGWVALPSGVPDGDAVLGVGQALRTLLEGLEVERSTGDLGRERPDAQLRATLRPERLAAALEALVDPAAAAASDLADAAGEGLPVQVLLRDGLLVEVVADVGALLPDPGGAQGGDPLARAAAATSLRMEVLATGDAVPPLRRPDDVVELDRDTLDEALAALAALGLLDAG